MYSTHVDCQPERLPWEKLFGVSIYQNVCKGCLFCALAHRFVCGHYGDQRVSHFDPCDQGTEPEHCVLAGDDFCVGVVAFVALSCSKACIEGPLFDAAVAIAGIGDLFGRSFLGLDHEPCVYECCGVCVACDDQSALGGIVVALVGGGASGLADLAGDWARDVGGGDCRLW